MRFRYGNAGQWFKGSVHLHSTASDGGKPFGEMAAMYASAGYDFLFRTDHWVCSDVSLDVESHPLLWLDGVELDGQDETGAGFHVVCLGRVEGLERSAGLCAGLRAAREQGALLVLAHPHWCGNTLDDALRAQFDGVEVYNHVCRWLNGKSNGLVHWDAMLKRNPDTLGFAVDDAHLVPSHPGWDGGWIMVNAERCTSDDILPAIRRGEFYATCGPLCESLVFDGRELRVKTTPVQFARLVGPNAQGIQLGSFGKECLTEVCFTLPQDWDYVYLELEDDRGKRAWTNTLFTKTE